MHTSSVQSPSLWFLKSSSIKKCVCVCVSMPRRLMENVQLCVTFWRATSHMAAACCCQCEGFIVRELSQKKKISHGSHGAVYCILVYTRQVLLPLSNTFLHTFIPPTPPESLRVLLPLSLSLLPPFSLPVLLRCPPYVLEIREFLVLCQCLFKIFQCCVSPRP